MVDVFSNGLALLPINLGVPWAIGKTCLVFLYRLAECLDHRILKERCGKTWALILVVTFKWFRIVVSDILGNLAWFK
jgi:hypothetical protein